MSEKLLVLELYSGTQSVGIPFRLHGHEVISVEVNEMFTKEPYNLDQVTMSIADLTIKMILKLTGGRIPDIVWASPLCKTFSMAASSAGHRQKINGKIFPKSVKAHLHDSWLIHTLNLITELYKLNPSMIYFIENPQGGMKNAWFMDEWNERGIYRLTYCQYEMHKPREERRMKPTNIWTNHPNPRFLPGCKNGADCHVPAPRGSKTGTQGLKGDVERAVIPKKLCEHIVAICEEV